MKIDDLIEQLQDLKRVCPGSALAPIHLLSSHWCPCCDGEDHPHEIKSDMPADRVIYAGGAVCVLGVSR